MGIPPILCLVLSIFPLVVRDESSVMCLGTLERDHIHTEEREI